MSVKVMSEGTKVVNSGEGGGAGSGRRGWVV